MVHLSTWQDHQFQEQELTLGFFRKRASHHSTSGTASSSMAGFFCSCLGRSPRGMAFTSPITFSGLAGLLASSPN